ncbi:MAG: ABC transporter permease [Anaerolineaceae bacterium]|jgi:ABC-type dipeptide/oligopeptide/nickel transport system permease component|nr:ABC transporter permease [Anaerolineae bacterium]MDX9829085.1 ABC transporter permease [Anaerolineae bacterium]NLF12194.1 ABC transporter permease [Anaerolineaceae bacterium]
MGRFILMRLLGLVPVLLILSIFTFAIMHEVPGAPWKYGQRPFSEAQIAALEARYGLDKPVWQQYLIWLRGVLRLDLGMSFEHPDESVLALIARTWPTTAHLGGMALLIAFGVGVPLGLVAALKQNTWIDYMATLTSIVGFVTPHFVWGILFILIFSLALKWLPTGGWEGPKTWIMPVVAYCLAPIATIARYTRAAVIEVLRTDYVRTARAKGLRERTVLGRHVMKNALIPLITVFGPLIPDLITGSIFIEAIFRVPGLGKFWVTSTINRDYPVIIGLTMLWAVLIAITYLISDILYVAADPRVHYN